MGSHGYLNYSTLEVYCLCADIVKLSSVDLKALKDEPLLETINYSRTTLVARCKFCSVGPPYRQDKLVSGFNVDISSDYVVFMLLGPSIYLLLLTTCMACFI